MSVHHDELVLIRNVLSAPCKYPSASAFEAFVVRKGRVEVHRLSSYRAQEYWDVFPCRYLVCQKVHIHSFQICIDALCFWLKLLQLTECTCRHGAFRSTILVACNIVPLRRWLRRVVLYQSIIVCTERVNNRIIQLK